jgi:hypothetical protein
MQLPSETLLPPGPWHAHGNEVRDGYGNVIAHIIYKRFPLAVGEWIAALPSLIANAEVDALREEIVKLKAEVADLSAQLDEAAEAADF